MASRKESKEQARAQRLAREQAHDAQRQRKQRMVIFGGVIAAAVVVVAIVVIVSVLGGGKHAKNTSTGLASGAEAHRIVASVNTELAGIPQHGATLGEPSAKVTMEYFGDLECPVCQDFTLTVLPKFIQTQVRSGKVKVVYRSICTATCDHKLPSQQGAIFARQQVAAYAAGSQGKFWQYVELFYHQQKLEGTGYPTDAFLLGIAKQVQGLDLKSWQRDRKDPAFPAVLSSDASFATKAGLSGTPSLIMKGPKGEELVDANQFPAYGDMVAAVKRVS